VAFAAIALTALFVPGRAGAASSASINASGPYSGQADAAQLQLTVADLAGTSSGPLDTLVTQVLNLLGLSGANVAALTLDPTTAAVDSDGPINGDPSQRAFGFASNLDPAQKNLLDSINLSSVLTTVQRTAPRDTPPSISDNLLAVPLSPLLTATVAPATATANWAGDGECPSSTSPISSGRIDVAEARVLPGTLGGTDLLNIGSGVSYIQSTTSLPSIGGTARAVQTQSQVNLGSVNLFNTLGGTNGVRIGVEPATLTSTATGLPGGANYVYTQPNLVNLNDGTVLTVAQVNALINSALGPLLGVLRPIVDVQFSFTPSSTGPGSADGTNVSKDITVANLRVNLLPALGGAGLNLVNLDLVPLHAEATAPAGGINCVDNPVKINKTATKTDVKPGESFDYNITFTNTATDCTLTNTSLTDVISGPSGSSVTGTNPTATSVNGLTVNWGPAVVGDLAPGQSKTFTVTVKTSTTARPGDSFDDTATGAGDCGGLHYMTPFTLNDIPKVVSDLLARTGADPTLPMLGAAALVLAALGFRRLRRA